MTKPFRKNSQYAYVDIEGKVYRVTLRVHDALASAIEDQDQDSLDEIMRLVCRRCPCIVEVDLVLEF